MESYDLAKKFLMKEFAAIYDIDSGRLSEWLAENEHTYANLTDEDEIERAIASFRRELDRLVRMAIADFDAMEELTAAAARIEARQAA